MEGLELRGNMLAGVHQYDLLMYRVSTSYDLFRKKN